MIEHRLLAFAALLTLPVPAALAQGPPTYSGYGFLEHPPLAGSRARTVALTDVAGSDRPDLAVLQDDGTLYLNVDATEYGTTATAGGLVGMAATNDGADRLWVTDGARILSVGWDDLLDAITLTGPPTVHFSGGVSVFQAQERPSGMRLLAIDSGGTRAQMFEWIAGAWTLTGILWANVAQGVFHDLALVDWLGVGASDLAVTTNQGLWVVSSSGTTLYSETAAPDDSWVAVLPGNRAAWGRDLLFWHRKDATSGAVSLRIANAVHSETLQVGGLALEDVVFADFMNAGDVRDEVILSRGNDRSAWVIEQAPGATPGDPIFDLETAPLSTVDLSSFEQSAPNHAAPLAVGDVEGDGDEDLVFVNDKFTGLWVLSTSFNEQALRPILTSTGSPVVAERSYSFLITVTLPIGDSFEWELYYQPDSATDVVFLNGGTGTGTNTPLLLTATLPPFTESEVIQFLVRGVDSATGARYPAQVEYWSTNSTLYSTLQNEFSGVYPWIPQGESADDGGRDGGAEDGVDPGGTTPRPKINPGP